MPAGVKRITAARTNRKIKLSFSDMLLAVCRNNPKMFIRILLSLIKRYSVRALQNLLVKWAVKPFNQRKNTS
jgi:hypothetical protein